VFLALEPTLGAAVFFWWVSMSSSNLCPGKGSYGLQLFMIFHMFSGFKSYSWGMLAIIVAWYWLNCDLVLFMCFARVNSGETWYFRPDEPVSPKREYQKLFPRTCASCRSDDELMFWARVQLAQARRSRLSEITRRPLFPHFELSPRWKELAWAREPPRLSETFYPERELGENVLKCCFVLYTWMIVTCLVRLLC